MSVLLIGDPHIGKGSNLARIGIGSTLNSRLVDQLTLLDWILDRAIEHHTTDIIITGDVYEDPKPASNLIVLFMAWLKKCQVHQIKVHIILGNHDILRSGFNTTSSLDIITEAEIDGISVYKDTNTIMIRTSAFTLMPYRDRKAFSCPSNAEALALVREGLVYELASIPSTYHKVVVGHFAIEGSIPIGDELDDLTNELFLPSSLFQGYDYCWMGHVHKPQVMQKSNPMVSHIGSMDLSNFGETDHKKHIVIFDPNQGTFEIEHLPTRPLQKISITVPKDTVDTTAYVLQQIKQTGIQDKAIVRVEVSLANHELISINKSEIDKYLLANGASTVNSISESKKINLIKKDSSNNIDNKMDVGSAIKTYAQTYIDELARSNFIELAMDIYAQYKEDK
jgi:DNA repair exonuclease SbcCD nuclease subunit